MIIYQKCLKRLAIAQIVLTAIEILVVILIYAFLGRAASAEAHKASLITSLPQYGIELFSGIVVLIMYQQKKRYNLLFRIEIALFIGLIVLKSLSFLLRFEGTFIDTQAFIILLILLTIYQTGIVERSQASIIGRSISTPADGRKAAAVAHISMLDLKLSSKEEWFAPHVIGPSFRLNNEISGAINDFLETQENIIPLEINVHGLTGISETMQGMMRDVLKEHYSDEMKRFELYSALRYRRALILIILSIIILEVWLKMNGENAINLLTIVLSNIAVISLWQVGTVFFERKDAHLKGARAAIAKEAKVVFM